MFFFLLNTIGAHYAITTHTGLKKYSIVNSLQQSSSPTNSNTISTVDLNINIKLIGEKGKTKFIPLQHSQLNKQAFISGKKDVFDIIASDVGRVRELPKHPASINYLLISSFPPYLKWIFLIASFFYFWF